MAVDDINRIVITGNLTRDCELQATQRGTQVLTFGIASNRSAKNHQTGNYDSIPNFFEVTMYGTRAETLSRLLEKGQKVMVSGALRYSQWEKDGQKRSRVFIVADDILIASHYSKKPEPQQQGGVDYYNQPNAYQQPAQQPEMYQEDCPF